MGKAAYAIWFSPDGVLHQCESTDGVNFGPTTPITYTLYDDMHWRIYDDPERGALICVAEKGKFDPKHRKDCYPVIWDSKTGHMTAWSYEKTRWMVTRLSHIQTAFPAGLAKQCPGLPKSVPINRKQTATDYKTLFKQDPSAVLTGAKLGIKDDPKWADQVAKWKDW